MADTYLAVVGYGTGDAEALQAFADIISGLNSILCAFLECNGSTYNVGPLGILEADHLRFLTSLVGVETSLFTNFVCLFDRSDTVCVQTSKNLLDATVLRFELNFSKHNNSSLF